MSPIHFYHHFLQAQNPKVIATMQHLMMMQDIHDPGAIREYMLKHVNDPELRPLLEIIARHEY